MLRINENDFSVFYKTDSDLIIIKDCVEVYFFKAIDFLLFKIEDNNDFFDSYVRHIKKDKSLFDLLKEKNCLKEVDSFLIDKSILQKI
jgi:hypothetical protein